MSSQPRAQWSKQYTFMLAAAASAIGLGNFWRFPYLAAKYGGGIFLLVYLALVVTFGFALMVTEVAIGRRTQSSGPRAFNRLHKHSSAIGWLTTAIPFIILPYYCAIGGWIIHYMTTYVRNIGSAKIEAVVSPDFFGGFISAGYTPLIYGAVFAAIAFLVVLFGVKNGIERSNSIMMPLLLLMSIIVAIVPLTQPGALEGLKFYLIPDFSKFSYKTVLGAIGQMFYSLSLAMGIMVTYGSYMRKDSSIEKSVRHIEVADTFIALLCGLMIIPACFVYANQSGIAAEEIISKSGPGLIFVTIPQVIQSLGHAGIAGSLFFVLIFFAAITSAISLTEALVASVHDLFPKLNRTIACAIVFVATFLFMVPSALGYSIWGDVTFFNGMSFLDVFDYLSCGILMPISALLICIFVGWVIGPNIIFNEAGGSEGFHHKKLYIAMIRYVAPALLVIILVSQILEKFGLYTI